jgi:MFS transporter, DHA1 family, multidrug resistance protein
MSSNAPTPETPPGKAPTGPTKTSKRDVFISLWMPAGASGLANGMIAPVLPALAISFDVSIGAASLVFVLQMAGSAVGTMPTGYMIDKFGRRAVLFIGPIVTAGAAFMTAFAGSFDEILFWRFVGGWGQQMWALSRLTVIADATSSSRGRQVTSMLGAQRTGTLLGPIVGGFVAVAWGLQWPFVIQGIVLLVGVLPSVLVIKDVPKRKQSDGKPLQRLTWRTFLVSPIPAVFSAQFLVNIARGGVENGGVLFLYGAYAYDAGPVALGVLSSVMAGASIPIALASGYVMDTRGRKWAIVPGTAALAAALVFMAATSFASLPYSSFVLAFVLTHVGVSMMLGSWQTVGTDVAPDFDRGKFFGVSRMISHTGRLSSPGSFGLFSELAGFGAAFSFLALASIMSGGLVLFFVKETLGLQVHKPAAPETSDSSS